MLGLESLPGQVTLTVDDPLRLARRTAGESDQGRLVGRQLGSLDGSFPAVRI